MHASVSADSHVCLAAVSRVATVTCSPDSENRGLRSLELYFDARRRGQKVLPWWGRRAATGEEKRAMCEILILVEQI